ncbi:MAG TPA: 16S rRNA (cytosine(1402)-N(4))-methyltransferase RsmH [Patescibacteria group bacterium]|nr:16S rRNA (cytosine(1402)-N(4))-methyltransferase RsmH [Patescibacteria group bacterium]
MNNYHVSVLLKEVIEYLKVKENEKYIDATLGGGGHSLEILRKGGGVLGIDVDQEALSYVGGWRLEDRRRITLARENFRNIDSIAKGNGFEQVAGILFDFGVSSHQIDDPKRGFTFQQSANLDMRMDQDLGVTAKDLVNALSKKDLIEVFSKYGEERFAHGIATEIVNVRKEGLITTSEDLLSIINRVMPAKLDRIAAAARIFQSLRIVVNDELHAIEETLPKALSLLKPKGRLVAISFHSLEDRIVKNTFKEFEAKNFGKILTAHPIGATDEEMKDNVRSRSAKLRAFEKL